MHAFIGKGMSCAKTMSSGTTFYGGMHLTDTF